MEGRKGCLNVVVPGTIWSTPAAQSKPAQQHQKLGPWRRCRPILESTCCCPVPCACMRMRQPPHRTIAQQEGESDDTGGGSIERRSFQNPRRRKRSALNTLPHSNKCHPRRRQGRWVDGCAMPHASTLDDRMIAISLLLAAKKENDSRKIEGPTAPDLDPHRHLEEEDGGGRERGVLIDRMPFLLRDDPACQRLFTSMPPGAFHV